ncbi:MAG: Fic family protein [Betaproteobacteria bacterium]|nr:Fic family protein [Betaproteobacteria bacterium]
MTTPVHYQLDAFPPEVDWARLAPIIGQASRAVATYAGLLQGIPDTEILLSSLSISEAVSSSRIEGTRITMPEALQMKAEAVNGNGSREKMADFEEVINCRQALLESAAALEHRPLSIGLLRQAHELLMQGVRGKDKNPGKLRTRQNWIGRPGATVDQASYVPIAQEHLQVGIEKWETYLNRQDQRLDPLVQLAIIHAEFEALHPFEDGNGRLGRMIIPLFLHQRGILPKPHFYMSQYLERNRSDYLDSLLLISKKGAWTDWCAFFLEGMTIQAKENQQVAQRIHALFKKMLEQVSGITRSHYAPAIINFLFEWPVFSTALISRFTTIPKPTAERLARKLCDAGILKEVRKQQGRKAALLLWPELFNIALEKEI